MVDLESLQRSVDEVKGDMKVVKSDLSQLVRVEERIASLLSISEKNSQQIVKLWEHVDGVNRDIGKVQTGLAVNEAVDGFSNKLVWAVVAGVITICASIIGSNFL